MFIHLRIVNRDFPGTMAVHSLDRDCLQSLYILFTISTFTENVC